jgi:hypothetical protein
MPALQDPGMEIEARIAAAQELAMFAVQLIDDQHVSAGNNSPVDVFLGFFETFDPASTGISGGQLQVERRKVEIVVAQLRRAQENRHSRAAPPSPT